MKTEKDFQEMENGAYKKLRKIGYKVEMSEAYVPIHLRRYAVMTNRETIFEGGFLEFVKFADETDDDIINMKGGKNDGKK